MEIPETMRAAFVRSTGGADLIEVGNLPTPRPAHGEVLVKFLVSDVNHVDLFVRSGAYRTPLPLPFVLGRDLVGEVVDPGHGTAGFAVGDLVWTNSMGHAGRQGTWSEYVAVPARRLYPLPDGVDPETAVPVLHTAATAHLGLFRRAHLAAGDVVFVGGAGGGVGTATVQLARAAGARVVATASPRDFDWCRAQGADEVFDYHDPVLFDLLRDAAPEGYGLWWDNGGHHDFAATLPLMRQGGSIVVAAGMSAAPVLPIGQLYLNDISIHGFVISNASVEDLAAAAQAINGMLAERRLPARVADRLSLSEARRAHELMASGHVRGRVLITP